MGFGLVTSTVHTPDVSEYRKPSVMEVMVLLTTVKPTTLSLLVVPDQEPSSASGGLNVAVTDLSPFSVTTHIPVPVQAPDHPANVECGRSDTASLSIPLSREHK